MPLRAGGDARHTPDKTDVLKEHLVKILKCNGDGKLCYRHTSKDVLIWWQRMGKVNCGDLAWT